MDSTPIETALAADASVPEPGIEDIWMPTPGVGADPVADLLRNPKVKEILGILSKELLLVEPTLRFVRLKEAEMAQAKLGVLYTADELNAMREAVKDG